MVVKYFIFKKEEKKYTKLDYYFFFLFVSYLNEFINEKWLILYDF